MSENPFERQLQEIEGADVVDQLNHWSRLYSDPGYRPLSPRIPMNEFYSFIMPRYTGWLIKHLVFVVIFALIAAAAGLGIKHGLDHRHAQNLVIEEQQLEISVLSGGDEDGQWWVDDLELYNHGVWGPEDRLETFAGLEHHDFYPNLLVIHDAYLDANRLFNRWPTRAGLGLMGTFSFLLFARRLLRLNGGISAVRRLNSIMLAEDAKARIQ